jgi:hypothetical protein
MTTVLTFSTQRGEAATEVQYDQIYQAVLHAAQEVGLAQFAMSFTAFAEQQDQQKSAA